MVTYSPVKKTVELPTPPDCVITTISPFSVTAPVVAISLFEVFHSTEMTHSIPATFRPRCYSKLLYSYSIRFSVYIMNYFRMKYYF